MGRVISNQKKKHNRKKRDERKKLMARKTTTNASGGASAHEGNWSDCPPCLPEDFAWDCRVVHGHANPTIMSDSALPNPALVWAFFSGKAAWELRVDMRFNSGYEDHYFPSDPYPKDRVSPLPVISGEIDHSTTTFLLDGSKVVIGGVHDGLNAPDHCVYNTVTLVPPTGFDIVIYGYPSAVFPDTHSHTATLVTDTNSIYIIGGKGWDDEPARLDTPVYRLDLKTYAITQVHAPDGPHGATIGHRVSKASSHDANSEVSLIVEIPDASSTKWVLTIFPDSPDAGTWSVMKQVV